MIAIAFGAALAGRAVVVYLLMPLLRGARRIPATFLPVLVWSGLRGAVSLALVLSIPLTLPNGQPFPDRELLQVIAFGVVGASLLLQGLTVAPLLRRLGLQGAAGRTAAEGESAESAEGAAELLRARLAAVEGALLALSHEHNRGEIGTLQYARLSGAYQSEHTQLEEHLRQIEDRARDED